MCDLANEIKKCKSEIERLETEVSDFDELRKDYLFGRRDQFKDYPNWKHPFHRTPMDWVNYMVGFKRSQLAKQEERLTELYKQRPAVMCEYFRELDIIDISEIIDKDGYIIGIKL